MKITTLKQAADAGYTFSWNDDWEVGDHAYEYGEAYEDVEPETCEGLTLYGPDGEMIANLGCIDDATEDSRREYELAMLSEIPQPDTYATSEIDRVVAEEIKTTNLYDGDDGPRYALSIRADNGVTATKWMTISPAELSEIRAVLARRTL